MLLGVGVRAWIWACVVAWRANNPVFPSLALPDLVLALQALTLAGSLKAG